LESLVYQHDKVGGYRISDGKSDIANMI